MNWVVKNWAALLLLFAGICACIATFYLSKQDQQQKDAIEKLGIQNLKLSGNIEKLNNLNIEIGENVKEITSKNLELTTESKVLIKEVQLLAKQSKELIEKIDATTSNEAAENLQTGELFMQFKSTFEDDDVITAEIGGTSFGNKVSLIEKGAKLFQIDGKQLLTVRFKNQKILLSLNVYDFYGNLIAEIKDNYWRPNKNFTGKFNYDQNGFEVVNNQGNISVNVDFVGNNKIVIQGIFPFRDERSIIIAEKDRFSVGTLPTSEIEFNKLMNGCNIRQLFEYTGKNWLHQRIKY